MLVEVVMFQRDASARSHSEPFRLQGSTYDHRNTKLCCQRVKHVEARLDKVTVMPLVMRTAAGVQDHQTFMADSCFAFLDGYCTAFTG